jgi:hypothetical protein
VHLPSHEELAGQRIWVEDLKVCEAVLHRRGADFEALGQDADEFLWRDVPAPGEGAPDRLPHEGAWHEQLGREGVCLHFLTVGLAVAPVDAYEAVDENRLAFVDQEVPDFVRSNA